MSRLNDLIKFIHGVKAESQHILWPTMRETRQMTIMVFILAGLIALFLVGADLGIGALLNLLLGLNA